MMDRECGTKQLKTVIVKENLKKPKQTQKKTSEQIVFVGTLGMAICGISKSDSIPVELQNANGWGRYTMTTDMFFPVEKSKR